MIFYVPHLLFGFSSYVTVPNKAKFGLQRLVRLHAVPRKQDARWNRFATLMHSWQY